MVPKPAHSGCESWLQSVWAVGWHLSQYSSAVDAFAAPGTCKQLAPQITVICDGARYQPVPQPQADLAPANSTVDISQSDADMQQVSKHIHWVMPTFSCAVVWPCNTAGLGFLPWGCYVAPVWRARPCTTRRQLYTAASAAWCRLPGMCLTQGTLPPNPRNHCNCRVLNCGGETCQQSLRGAVLVPSTCGWDTLAAAVVRRSQAVHCSHLRSRVSVGLEAPKSNQHRAQSGRESGSDLRQQCS